MRKILIYILILLVFPCTSFGDVTKGLVGWWTFDNNSNNFPTPSSGDLLVGSVSDNNFHSTTLTPTNGWSTVIDDGGGSHGWHDALVDKVSGGSPPYANTGTFSPTTNYDIGAGVVAFKAAGTVTRVHSTSYNADGTSITAPITATTAGNLVVVYVACQNLGVTVTDSKGDSYSYVGELYYSNFAYGHFFYFANVPSGATSVTISESGSDYFKAFVAEYSGVATSSPLDGSAGFDNAAGGTYTSGNAVSPIANTTNDSSGNSNTGTLGNMTSSNVVAGKMSQGLSFDGSTQYVTIPNAASLEPNHVSIAAWFKANSLSGTFYSIVSKAQTGPPWTSPYLSYLLRVNSSTLVEADVGSASSFSNNIITVSALSTGIWYHLAMTYDGTTVTTYLNGKSIGTNTTISGNINYVADPVIIGADYDQVPLGEYFNATIDDVRIYNRALTAAEIWDIYQGGDSMKFGPD